MGRLILISVVFALMLCLPFAEAHADVQRKGTQIPEEAIELKAAIADLLSEIDQINSEHDMLVKAHDNVLTLLHDFQFAPFIDPDWADTVALGACGGLIYGADDSVPAEEQSAVSEWLVSCYQTYCSLIQDAEAEIRERNELLWQLEAELNSIILATQAPTPAPSSVPSPAPTAAPQQTPLPSPAPTPGMGGSGSVGFPTNSIPAASPIPSPSMPSVTSTPTPIPSASPQPGWNGRL